MDNEELIARLKIPHFDHAVDLMNYIRTELTALDVDYDTIDGLLKSWYWTMNSERNIYDMYDRLNRKWIPIKLPLHLHLAYFDIRLAPASLTRYYSGRDLVRNIGSDIDFID